MSKTNKDAVNKAKRSAGLKRKLYHYMESDPNPQTWSATHKPNYKREGDG